MSRKCNGSHNYPVISVDENVAINKRHREEGVVGDSESQNKPVCHPRYFASLLWNFK